MSFFKGGDFLLRYFWLILIGIVLLFGGYILFFNPYESKEVLPIPAEEMKEYDTLDEKFSKPKEL